VLRSIERWLVILLLVVIISAHWTVLQSAAWVGMLVTYSHGATIQEAWDKTFDGKHPCKLCHLVKSARATEKQQDTLKTDIKLEFTFPGQTARLLPFGLVRHRTPAVAQAGTESNAPLLPPPRAA